jgi:NADH:ubiquinone oxidoreductase subunit D
MEAHHDYSVFADSNARTIVKIAELQKSLKLVNEEMCHLRKAGSKEVAEG